MVTFFHFKTRCLQKGVQVAGVMFLAMGVGQSLHAEIYAGLTPGTDEWRERQSVDPAEAQTAIVPTVDLENAVTLQTRYEGTLSGIDLGYIDIRTQIADSGYSIMYKVRQTGLTNWIEEKKSNVQASGIFTDTEPASLYYHAHVQEGDEKYQYIEMVRNFENKRLRLWTEPAYALDRPVSPALTKTTLDPASALVKIGYLGAATGKTPCERTVEVFDGKRRFDLVMRTDKKTKLRNRGKGRYTGPVWRCKISRRKIAGYKAKDMKKKERVGFVYLADVPDAFKTAQFHYFPVLVSARRGFFRMSLEVVDPVLTDVKGNRFNLGNQ